MAPPDTVVRDQIDHTRNHTPEAPVAEAPLESVATAVSTPVPKPKPVAPPAPTNPAPASPPPGPTAAVEPPQKSDAPDHKSWTTLLQRHVSAAGNVNYAGFRQDEALLNEYLATLARKIPDDKWSKSEALAYWINAYNAYTIKLILNNWPVESIRQIDRPWEKKWIELADKQYSLDQIEHDIVRPTFREPRIHFALVCAAESCPPLANKAFTAPALERMLEERARNFINDEKFNVTQEAVVRVSPLFDWYGQDFGDIRNYLNRYLTTEIPPGKEIHFLDYDWSLND
ncbi:hypothetical protein GGR28_000441 [Lewinella aquimaris]|uniref:DUF547 domain-containing protein n=1 Tax=Neolewinella aquimaris TaxID=1835722 RepID=A0A840DY38_9BACT|nr:DUF547 domain-containing protein [Neolewinella aquimaris]MBB4077840.1 hypothetical protein [Neolewinella aquimaris]